MATTLTLVRHAEQIQDGRFWQHGCPGLTTKGTQQAAELGRRIGTDTPFPTVVLASNAKRAIQTAEPVAAATGRTLATTCALCEMHPGAAEGLTQDEMTDRFGPHYGLVPDAEWFPDWVSGAVERLREIVNANRGEVIFAVTHTAVFAAVEVAFDGADPWNLVKPGPPYTASRSWLFES